MRRFQLFEFNESSFCPGFIRDSIVEALGRSLRWGKFYNGAAGVFNEFIKRSGSRRMLDLCSGTGETVGILIDALRDRAFDIPRVIVSDLFPKEGCMKLLAKRYPGKVEVYPEALDARKVPADIVHDCRSFLTSFHHFPPQEAAAILADCVTYNKPVFIIEPFPREIRCFVPVFFLNFLAYAFNPFLTGRNRILKFIFTFLFPLIPFMGLWDGLVSLNRVYGREELLAMTAVTPGFSWEFQTIKIGAFGEITLFYGIANQ